MNSTEEYNFFFLLFSFFHFLLFSLGFVCLFSLCFLFLCEKGFTTVKVFPPMANRGEKIIDF